MGSLKVIMIFLAVAQCFTFFFLMMCKTLLFCLYDKENSKHAKQFWIGREPWGCEDNDCKGGKGVTARRQLGYLQQTAPQEALRALQKTLQRSRTLEKYINAISQVQEQWQNSSHQGTAEKNLPFM